MKIGKIIKSEEDEYIFYEGEKGDCLYIILSGKVEIFKISDIDDSKIILAVISVASIFGEMSLITKDVRTASARALENVLALKINEENFYEFISLKPDYIINMLTILSERIFEVKCKI